jgi:hypothetical protein
MADSGRYVWDESEFPLVRVEAPQTPADAQRFQELLDWYSRILKRGLPFVMLFELGRGVSLSVERRDQIRRHALAHGALITAHQRGLGIVAMSAYQRAMARALLWMVKPPCPAELFAAWQPAREWAKHQMLGSAPTDRTSHP